MSKKYSVAILDMFHYQDPEHEYEIDGFSALEHAKEYAKRRVRDSLEDFRDQGKSDDEIGRYWYQFGEDAVVIGGKYAGGSELEYFIQHPATAEERDWQSIEPNEETSQFDKTLARFKDRSKKHLHTLLLWVAASFITLVISYSISSWAEYRNEWQGIFIYYLFNIVSVLSGFTFAFFLIFVYSWFRGYSSAEQDASKSNDWDRILLIHRDVLGPIPWK